MPNLTDRIDAQLEGLTAERRRIHQQAALDVAAVDAKIEALAAARKVLTPDVERSYAQLKGMGLFKEL